MTGNPKTEILKLGFALFVPLLARSLALADDITDLCASRSAIERVYYNHRTGTKPPFEQVTPPSLIERLVKVDLHKEAVLKKAYGVVIAPALLDGEVQRINTGTRAPERLAEIKTALGPDPSRFAEAFAKPILVERLLRNKFENDAALHAPQRRECEQLRDGLLAAKSMRATTLQLLVQIQIAASNAVSQMTWQLSPRPAATNTASIDEIETRKRFGQQAQLVSAHPAPELDQGNYFEDLPGELQRVLQVQLRQPGDVSAVIELPGGFVLYLATDKTEKILAVACVSWPKRNYEQWLNDQ